MTARKSMGARLGQYFRSRPERADRLAGLVERTLRHRHQFAKQVFYSVLGKTYPVFLDYEINERPRFGYGLSPHPELYSLMNTGRDRYASLLTGFLELRDSLAEIPSGPEEAGPADPTWVNDYFGGLDGVALYGLLVQRNPERFFEVGSGTSTKFARRAIRDHGLRTRITSIDPEPRAEVDALCDEVIRKKLEDVDLAALGPLGADDILFIDGSHRAFMNSDVTVFFLEILPRLPAGVLIEMHDILLPADYPPEWVGRHYSEQYLLAAFLLGGGRGIEIVLPNAFVTDDPELAGILSPLWTDPRMITTTSHGGSFWMRTTGELASLREMA